MKNRKIKKTVLIVVSVILMFWSAIYYLSSFNYLYINIPCVGLTEYTFEEFINLHNIQTDEYYHKNTKTNNEFDIADLRSGNVNTMKGLSEFYYASQIESLQLNGTCISQISDLDNMTSLNDLFLNDTNIKSMDGLEGLNSLEHIYLDNTKIKTIENVENIRTDTSGKLIIFISGKVNSITEESYEYVMNPDNQTSISIFDSSKNLDLTFGCDTETTREDVEEQIDII